jgi:hypothetical protein
VNLDRDLLYSTPLASDIADFHATIKARGLYNNLQFVLRLSPEVHRALSALPNGIVKADSVSTEGMQAFSTFLHETIHWWQHVGSTYGLMLSLSYPAQAHANIRHLKKLVEKIGFKKSVRKFAASCEQPKSPDTFEALANTVVNNHFDFTAFRLLTYDEKNAKRASEDPYFEAVGHAYQITYANNLLILAATVDPQFNVIRHPKDWETHFQKLREQRELGYYYGSPVEIWPVGARAVLEGQACFIQLQYLAFASRSRLDWDDFRSLGMLQGIYVEAFEQFLKMAELDWPPSVDHPTVALFLLLCDMAINPGSGFPHALEHFSSFITDVDPGVRFCMLATLVKRQCRAVATALGNYTREQYLDVSGTLSAALRDPSPLSITTKCSQWIGEGQPLAYLLDEHRTFDFLPVNPPVRVLFSHFLVFMRDKMKMPEFFCWPGAWMAGDRVSDSISALFDQHCALFVDKEDDDGIFPRMVTGRDPRLVQEMFDTFYNATVLYDMTDQWITQPGPFSYNYRWLSQSGTDAEIKGAADRTFEQAYGVLPDHVQIID